MNVQEFYDPPTFTLTYVVYDETTKDAIVIDPVLDYEPMGSTVSNESASQLVNWINDYGLKIHYIIETHAHADHLTSAQFLKEQFPQAITAIHENICAVQTVFKEVFNFKDKFDTSGEAFDQLLKDGQKLTAGSLNIEVIHTPGHTPACVSLLINDEALFTGDAIFMPDFGTGRCDFPKGSAEDLYHSIHDRLYRLNDEIKVYVGHDYQPGGRELEFQTTIGEQKAHNVHLNAQTRKEEYVKFRSERDATLMAPRLLLPSIQINAQNGQMPDAEDNGSSYLKIPLRTK